MNCGWYSHLIFPMLLDHYLIAIFCILFGVAIALIYIKHLKRSLKQKWPKANPDAWKDKDED